MNTGSYGKYPRDEKSMRQLRATHELNNLAEDPAYTDLMLKYARKMLSWGMANDEHTLTHIRVGPDGIIVRS